MSSDGGSVSSNGEGGSVPPSAGAVVSAGSSVSGCNKVGLAVGGEAGVSVSGSFPPPLGGLEGGDTGAVTVSSAVGSGVGSTVSSKGGSTVSSAVGSGVFSGLSDGAGVASSSGSVSSADGSTVGGARGFVASSLRVGGPVGEAGAKGQTSLRGSPRSF